MVPKQKIGARQKRSLNKGFEAKKPGKIKTKQTTIGQ